ncbi:hypothetical protein V8J36_18075 [Frigidibacter sp. MR17.14]|uniref:hypothetical protein n=1 Tax=Frigidibacter sp. MR17.14 TaxID=3126509 RepID=UPI0030131183
MSRHLVDKRSPSDGGRMKHFVAAERRSGPEGSHPAVMTKLREPKLVAGGTRRMKEFLRIARGHTV